MDVSTIPPALRSGSPALFRRAIAVSLQHWRNEVGLTQKDAAARLARSVQHISNLEGANRATSAGDLELLLGLYGKQDRIPFMRELLAATKKANTWYKEFSGVVPEWFNLYLGLESGAAELSSFEAMVVPGLLQKRDYARAVISGDPDLTDDEVEQGVELRLARQQILGREIDPVRLWAVIDESVLYRTRGDDTVMHWQLKHLLEMSEKPGIDIQILPLKAGGTPSQDCGTFKLMKFPLVMENDPGLVYLELPTGGKYVEKQEEIVVYERALTRLRALAADQKASRAIIRKALKEVT